MKLQVSKIKVYKERGCVGGWKEGTRGKRRKLRGEKSKEIIGIKIVISLKRWKKRNDEYISIHMYNMRQTCFCSWLRYNCKWQNIMDDMPYPNHGRWQTFL